MKVYKGPGGMGFSIHEFALEDGCIASMYTFQNAVDTGAVTYLVQNTFLLFSEVTTTRPMFIDWL